MSSTSAPNGIAADAPMLCLAAMAYRKLCRGLKPSQVLMALRMWTNTKTSPCPSAVQVAKAVGAGRSAVEELLKPLQSVEVAAGQTLCETLRFDSKATESN